MSRTIMLIAIALVAAACGGGESASTLESLKEGSSVTMPPTTTGSSPSSAVNSSSGATAPSTPPPISPVDLPDSDYPNVVVADLGGGDVNLKELVLEPKPVLLWFWAPH